MAGRKARGFKRSDPTRGRRKGTKATRATGDDRGTVQPVRIAKCPKGHTMKVWITDPKTKEPIAWTCARCKAPYVRERRRP